jgi:hypothetical protein
MQWLEWIITRVYPGVMAGVTALPGGYLMG